MDWKACELLLEASCLSLDLSFVPGGAAEAAGHRYQLLILGPDVGSPIQPRSMGPCKLHLRSLYQDLL